MAEGCLNAPNNVKKRTADIKVKDSVDFESLLLSEEILSGLKKCGFERPSPVQLKAIPLGRCGLDLVVQAKSGTGKTCVFSVIALESIMLNSPSTQVLVLAPTREIAVQIWQVIHSVGTDMTRLRCYTFIGGMPLSEDKVKLKKCHIAVGTPGRVRQLIEMKLLNTESIRLFVLDEADKLMEQGFQETINWIFSSLPENKQMLALSATYPESLAKHLTMYMKNPTFVRLNTDDLSLLGIRQYYQTVQFSPLQQKAFEIKSKMLMDLLNAISFQQCLIFSNYQLRAQSLADVLNKEGWPAAYISGSQDQQNRLAAMAKLKTFKCRILISTDLTSRGIDAENVNLIINMDVPHDHATYLHRIGRAGRYGTYGAAITLVSLGKEMADLKTIEGKAKTRILLLPDPVPADLVEASGYLDYSDHIIAVSTAKVTEHEPDEEISAACDMKSGYSDTCEEYNGPSPDNMNNKSAKYSIRSTQDEQDIIPKRETTQTVNEETSIKVSTELDSTEYVETDNGIKELIEELETKVSTEYVNIEQLLTTDDINTPGHVKENTSSTCLQGHNLKEKISAASDRETSSNKQTSVTIKDYDRVTGETCSSECSEIRRPVSSICAAQLDASLNLPTLHSLHTFVGHVKKSNVNVLDFTLPLLDDIIGTKRSTSASYADIMADYRQFKNTGKSILPLTSTLCSYDPSAYEIALEKVDMTMNDMCLLSMEKDGMNAAEIVQQSDVQSMCIDGKNLVKEEEMLRATSPILAKQVVGETVTVENGSSVMTCDNAQKMNTVSLLKDNDHSDKQTNSGLDDKIIGFSELNFHFGNTSPSQETRPKIAAMSGNPGMRKSVICTSSSNRTEDKDIGLEFMKRLQAQHDTDSSENSSSSFESDNDLEECYRTDTTGSDRQHHGGADKTEDCAGRNASYSYNSSHLPVYQQHVGEWDAHSEYSSWNWNDPDYPAGNANANYLLDHNIGSYHNMDYYGHYNFNFGGMQPFPHQLWAQCAHLLGSINAMQALQYSCYCHQWYLHHTRCAHLYASHSKKHKTKLKQNLKDA